MASGTNDDEGMPGWVKVFGVIITGVLLLVLISQFMGIEHGPGLHMP